MEQELATLDRIGGLRGWVVVSHHYLGQYFAFQPLVTDRQWLMDFRKTWIPSFGITFHLAVDGLSLLLHALTFFLGILAVLWFWMRSGRRTGFYHLFQSASGSCAGVAGVFMAMDLFLFYFSGR